MTPEPTATFSLTDFYQFLRKGVLWALGVAILLSGTVFLFNNSREPVYRARSTVLAAQTNPELRQFGVSLATAPSLDASAYRAAVLSRPVIEDVMRQLDLPEIDQRALETFRKGIAVRLEDTQTSSLIHIEVDNSSAAAAADRANALAGALVLWDQNRANEHLRRIITTLEQQIAALDQQIAGLRVSAEATQDQIDGNASLRAQQQEQLYYARALSNSAIGLLDVLEPASPPLDPIAPRPVRNGILAFIVGLLFTYGTLSLRDALTTHLQNSSDIVALTNLPILAEFPKLPAGTRRLPHEASNYLRTNLLFSTVDMHPKVLLVTSPQSSEGKSSVALSLAESFARGDYKTLLVDADLRKPVLAREYGLSEKDHTPLKAYLENQTGSKSGARAMTSL
jgi:non-specific protein-tyrosine kinase